MPGPPWTTISFQPSRSAKLSSRKWAATAPDASGQIFNVGNDERLSLGAIADTIVGAAGTGRVEYVPWPPDRDAIDIGSYFGDSSKAKRMLGWEPRTSFADGIARTLAFYRARAAWYL